MLNPRQWWRIRNQFMLERSQRSGSTFKFDKDPGAIIAHEAMQRQLCRQSNYKGAKTNALDNTLHKKALSLNGVLRVASRQGQRAIKHLLRHH
jgi:hypothetical protein